MIFNDPEFQLGDLHSLTTGDGIVTIFSDEKRVMAFGNYGMPPLEYVTSRGYRQHGETEIDYFLQSRALEITLYVIGQPNRQAYWDLRSELLDIIRPNRQGAMTLTVKRPDGSKRSIAVRANPGFIFPPSESNHWNIQEGVSLIAHDPIWFDPSATALTITETTAAELVFPITFPIVFGSAGVILDSGIIAYAGSWRSYPVLTITGPYNTVTITNTGNNAAFQLTVPIITGEQRIITLGPAFSIVDANGDSHTDELGLASNIVDFAIYPDSELSNDQQIQAIFIGGSSGQTAMTVAFNTRYIGI